MTMKTFPNLAGLTFPVGKQPVWSSSVQRSMTGKRTTVGYYSYPYYSFELQFSFLRQDAANKEYQQLLAFFNLVGGDRDLWQFVDPSDNAVTAQQFGTGDGTTTQFQLLRLIDGGGGLTWNDPVFGPLTWTIYDNGVAQASPANYTMGDYGVVNFTAAPAAGHALTWTGTFAYLCRFDQGNLDLSEMWFNFWELKKVIFSSEKLP